MAARLALTPALERMRSEMLKAAGGGAIKGSVQSADLKGLKRVVVLGGGPCGATVAHQLIHIHPGFHVTIVDTKEYYEDTPSVLRMMTANDCDEFWPMWTIEFHRIFRGASNAAFICGTAAAVRKDHLLVGTTNGIASQVVPLTTSSSRPAHPTAPTLRPTAPRSLTARSRSRWSASGWRRSTPCDHRRRPRRHRACR